jgi:hypothetical protein
MNIKKLVGLVRTCWFCGDDDGLRTQVWWRGFWRNACPRCVDLHNRGELTETVEAELVEEEAG